MNPNEVDIEQVIANLNSTVQSLEAKKPFGVRHIYRSEQERYFCQERSPSECHADQKFDAQRKAETDMMHRDRGASRQEILDNAKKFIENVLDVISRSEDDKSLITTAYLGAIGEIYDIACENKEDRYPERRLYQRKVQAGIDDHV
jgi:hypothetical protein